MTTCSSKYLEGAKKDLLAKALDYARAKKFGGTLNDGIWRYWCPTDQKMYVDNYLKSLENAAVRVLMEMTAVDPGVIP